LLFNQQQPSFTAALAVPTISEEVLQLFSLAQLAVRQLENASPSQLLPMFFEHSDLTVRTPGLSRGGHSVAIAKLQKDRDIAPWLH
jgi:hypothetical protein